MINLPEKCLKLKLTHVAVNLDQFGGKQLDLEGVLVPGTKKINFLNARNFLTRLRKIGPKLRELYQKDPKRVSKHNKNIIMNLQGGFGPKK